MNKNLYLKTLLKTQSSLKNCNPPYLLRNGHVQTILTFVKKRPKILKSKVPFLLQLENEKEKLYIEYIEGHTNLVLYLLHGLTGSSNSRYIQKMAKYAEENGHSAYLFNHRCSGAGIKLATKPYHNGRSEDISALIKYGREKHPHHIHIAIGFSMSGNALLLLAAKIRAKILPDIAIAVNPPIDIDYTSKMLIKKTNKIYNYWFMKELQKQFKKNGVDHKTALKGAKNVREFDKNYTAPNADFKSRAHYYKSCSAKNHFSKLAIPSLILTSKDDPFVSYKQYSKLIIPKNLILHFENHGGHLGYISGEKFNLYDWLYYALCSYIDSISDLNSNKSPNKNSIVKSLNKNLDVSINKTLGNSNKNSIGKSLNNTLVSSNKNSFKNSFSYSIENISKNLFSKTFKKTS